MKINFNKTAPKKVQWLNKDDYAPLAMALILSHTTDDDCDVAAVAAEVARYRDGGTTKKGKTVYIRNLLGALKAISPELVDEIMNLNNEAQPTKSYDSF